MFSKPLVLLAAASLASAHFTLNWPPTTGFDEDKEPTAPCGGDRVDVTSDSQKITVDQFAIDILSTHPTGAWTFSVSTDTKAPYNFTEIANVNTTGAGTFCLSEFHVPSSFAGKGGVLQVTDHSIDGVIYQCAPVNFVQGSNSTIGSNCKNVSSFTAVWASGAASSSGKPSSSGTTTSASASSKPSSTESSKGAAAMATAMGSLAGGLGMLAVGFAL